MRTLVEPLPGPGKVVDYLEHDGITLPVYDPATVIWGDRDLPRLGRSSLSHVVRYLRVNPLTRFVLGELLPAANEVFDHVAEQCDAKVIEHTWGLSPLSWELRDYYYDDVQYAHKDLPPNMSLVAEVPVLQGTDYPDDDEWEKINKIVKDCRVNPAIAYIWTDGHGGQFLRNEQGLHLNDIEPFVVPYKK